MIVIAMVKDNKQVRWTAAIGMGIQLIQAVALLFSYFAERNAGNTAEMLFSKDVVWYESLNIHYAVGVDGVSVAMILLTAIIIFAGVFASWEIEDRAKEFFITLILYIFNSI